MTRLPAAALAEYSRSGHHLEAEPVDMQSITYTGNLT